MLAALVLRGSAPIDSFLGLSPTGSPGHQQSHVKGSFENIHFIGGDSLQH
jgi:hypothetical protein